jgi:hypothetical protein
MTNKIPGQDNGVGAFSHHTRTKFQSLTEALRLSNINDVAKAETPPATSLAALFIPIEAANDGDHLKRIHSPVTFNRQSLPIDSLATTPLAVRSVDMALINRKFALNLFVMVRNPRQLSTADMNALQDNDFNRVAHLIFNGLDASTQPFNLDDPDHQCVLTHRALSELEHPVFVQPNGIFELKILLKWWLDKGTHPLSEQAMALEQIEKIRLPSPIAHRSSI